MKQLTKILIVILFLAIADISCKDDEPFYSIDPFETLLLNHVNDYRTSQGLNELVLLHDAFIDAREHSQGWKSSGDVSNGLEARMQDLVDKWEPTNIGVITSIGNSAQQDSAIAVVNSWINDSTSRSILLDEFTHSGPGIATTDDNRVYVTNFFLDLPY